MRNNILSRRSGSQDQSAETTDWRTHFNFGDNWADYAAHVDEDDIARAVQGLCDLLPAESWRGARVLDIGCGSGIHALAMLRLGASFVQGIDIDPTSVSTAHVLLDRFAPQMNWNMTPCNILAPQDNAALPHDHFDIVYSWGVLHHTGDLWRAVDHAVRHVRTGGYCVLALYKKTPLCGVWKIEKKFYTHAPQFVRVAIDYMFAFAYLGAVALSGQNPVRYLREYRHKRGMRFMTDIRDWLGGYPYESASPQEVSQNLAQHGFTLVTSLNTQASRAGGIFGTGCAEYVFLRQ